MNNNNDIIIITLVSVYNLRRFFLSTTLGDYTTDFRRLKINYFKFSYDTLYIYI